MTYVLRNPPAGRNGDADVKSRLVDIGGEGEGGTDRE